MDSKNMSSYTKVSSLLGTRWSPTITWLKGLSLSQGSYSSFLLSLLALYVFMFLLFQTTGESMVILCATVILDLFLILWLATRRFALSSFIVAFILVILYASGIYKRQMLDTPLLVHDIYFFFQDFSQNVTTFFQYPRIMMTTLGLLSLFVMGAIAIYRRESPSTVTRAIAMTTITFICLSAKPVASSYSSLTAKDMFDQVELIGNQSDYLSKFISSFAILNSDVDVDQLPMNQFQLGPVSNDNSKADIIAILHESAFDLTSIKGCPTYFCNINLFKEDANTIQSGFLKVHSFGGGTWLSEFAFLTGLDHRVFGDNGVYAPYTVTPRLNNSLIKNLKDQGYRTIAINPINGDFLHASEAYKHLGFDEIYASEQLGFSDEWLDVYDAHVYEKAIEFIKKSDPHTPLFVFMLTIQNHGPHNSYLNHNEPIVALNEDFQPKDLLEVYRQRYVQSITDIAQFEKFLLQRKKKTVVVRFGDHQPSFGGKVEDLEFNYPPSFNPKDKNYFTKYIIKTNFRSRHFYSSSHQDISLLSSDALKQAGVEMNQLFRANQTLKKKCHGLYLDCEDHKVFQNYLGFVLGRLKVYEP
jgi:hypothetical protein